jgi:Na+(H+)/acetate symporter ActP
MTPILASIDPWILSFSAVTVIVTIWMGFRSAKTSKTASDFFVAGRSVSVGWNASAISGEYLSAASFMGIAGMVMSSGYDALWYPVCYACGYLFLLLFIVGPLRRFGAYTIPDFAEGRYDSPVFRKIAVCFVLFIGFFYTMPQMKGAGVTLAYIFPGLPYWAGVVLVGAVITLNVALGGMKGITLVQAFQYWAKMFAISVPIFVLMAVYGHYGKQLGANGNVQHPTSNIQLSTNSATIATSDFGSSKLNLDPDRLAEFFLDPWEVNLVYGGILKNVDAAAQRFDVIDTELTLRTPTSPLDAAVATYESLRPHVGNKSIVYLDKSIPGGRTIELNTSSFPPWKGAQPASLVKKQIEQVFRSNGLEIVLIDASSVAIVSASNLPKLTISRSGEETFRKPLPEKAPADATWLSPFGPLTTKAAKAAKPKIEFEGILQKDELNSESVLRELAAPKPWRESWQETISRPALEIIRGCALTMFEEDAKKAGASFVIAYTSSLEKMDVRYSPTNAIPIGGTVRDIVPIMEKVLLANGIHFSKVGNTVTAFPLSEAKITPVDPKPYSLLYTYSLIIALICGTAGLPHILVRFYTNPDGGAAKRTTMWVMILIGIFYVFPPVFGVMGRNLFPELYNGIGAKGTDKIVLELPRLLNEKYAPLGSILSGITCAGAFAAFMSTFSGLLVSMTGALAHDVYGRMLRPKSTPEQRMRMFKFAAVLISFVSILLGSLVEPLEINFMVGQAFAIAAASYFPLLFMSVWWRKLTMKGAATGMLSGGLLALGGITLTSVSDIALKSSAAKGTANPLQFLQDFWVGNPGIRIVCEQPAIWAVPLAIILMIIISKLTAKEVPADIRMKMLVLHAPEKLGLKQEYIQEHQAHGH